MKKKYLVFAIAFAMLNVGCSDKKDCLQKNQEKAIPSEVTLDGKHLEDWKDSLKLTVIKEVVVPFIGKKCGTQDIKCIEKYNKDDLFWLIQWKCKKAGCPSYIRNERFVQDRVFLLDSLYRINVLDRLVELIQWSREKNKKDCIYQTQDGKEKECNPNPDLDLAIKNVLEKVKLENNKLGNK